MKLLIKNILYVSIFVSCSLFASAKNLKIAVGLSLPPYIIQESKTGMEIDVVKKVLEMSGYTLEPVFISFARVTQLMESGEVDGAMTVAQKT